MNFLEIVQRAKEMHKKMMEELESMEIEATSGGGMVKLKMNGKKAVLSLNIDPEVVNADDVEMLEDLIVAAFADGTRKVDETLEKKMDGVTGSFGMPGLFSK